MLYIKDYISPIGNILISSDGFNLTGLWIEGHKEFTKVIDDNTIKKVDLLLFDKIYSWLDQYFKGENPDISKIPMAINGSSFREEVWKILLKIPHGTITTYGDIAKILAKKLGKKTMSAQAIGGAIAHNPISIIIPCHRVIAKNGNLTGFASGIDKKIKLLELEKIDLSQIFIPQNRP